MKITFDTNSFGPICSPEHYPGNLHLEAFSLIRDMLERKRISPYLSEGSLSLESLSHKIRIDVFLRAWVTREFPIELPEPAIERKEIVNKAFALGFKVLRVPRVALGSFIEVPYLNWASDEEFSREERQNRFHRFLQNFPEHGTKHLRQVGTELVRHHNLDTAHLAHLEVLPNWPTASELMWKQGILAEFDCPKYYPSQKKFIQVIRDIIAEWADLDILASHYAYNSDYFCTVDESQNTGILGVLHISSREQLRSLYGINIVSPERLVELL